MTEVKVVRNDTKFLLDFTIYDLDNNIVDLSDVSTISLKFKSYADGTVTTISGSPVGDGSGGEVQFLVLDEFKGITGNFKAEIELIFSDGKILTAPNIVLKVIPDL